MAQENHSGFKTLGPRAAQFVTELHEQHRATFTIADVAMITGLGSASVRSLIRKAEGRGLVTRLKPGLFNLVPFELGRATRHVENPYLIARELVGGQDYFISHGSAFELHRMVTQPQLEITVSTIKRIRPQIVGGYAYRFVQVAADEMFGVTEQWITKQEAVAISDRERSIVDALRSPALLGGITEIAKGLWMTRDTFNVPRVIAYAVELDIAVVQRRLGYLLELYSLADAAALAPLQERLTAGYQRLDPLFPAEGKRTARWRLQLNIEPEELDAVRRG
jgi:predicted transcriptional regulator of viral defense system